MELCVLWLESSWLQETELVQAKDKEIAHLQQQLRERVSHVLLFNTLSTDNEYQWLW